MAKCLNCGIDYKCPPRNGTSTLWAHIERCYKNLYDVGGDKKQQLIGFKSEGCAGNGITAITNWKFDQEACRKALVRMIIVDELPFKMVERNGFRDFMNVAQPKFQVPSHTTVARDCLHLYLEEKKNLRNFLKTKTQRVCLTTDTWTSIQNMSYMCLTIHFIDEEWNLHKRILNFRPIHSHKGEEVGKALEKCLLDWGIQKVLTITVDNASSNDLCLSYLRKKMKDGSVLNGEFLHMRCCAHIINFIVKDGLGEIHDSIVRIRGAVRYIRSSPIRSRKFKESVEAVKIDCKGLLCLDVETRWNSTYMMLDAACKFQKAFENLRDHDFQYQYDLLDKNGIPSDDDWENAKTMVQFLKQFYETINCVSGSLYVTANNFFHEIYGIELAMNEMKNSDDAIMKFMAEKMMHKFEKYWGNIKNMNALLFIAVILDPRYKFDFVKWSFTNAYGVKKGAEMAVLVEGKLVAMFEEYNAATTSGQSSSVAEQEAIASKKAKHGGLPPFGSGKDHIKSLYRKHKQQQNCVDNKSELEKYLAENIVDDDDDEFDILKWWKNNGSNYSVLSKMAKYVLAIPISTVASESAVSTGGRVLDTFRSSLTPKTVEALVCSQDWLRAASLLFEVEERIDELEQIETEFSTKTPKSSFTLNASGN